MVYKKNKHGAVEMSLNLIIMLVIGLTVLGLVIAMVTGLIGSATNKFADKISASDQAIANELKNTPGILVSRPVQITIPRGGSGVFFSKIQNKGNIKITLPSNTSSPGGILNMTMKKVGNSLNCTYKVSQMVVIGGNDCKLILHAPNVGIIPQDSQVFPITVEDKGCSDNDKILLSVRFFDITTKHRFDESSSITVRIKG